MVNETYDTTGLTSNEAAASKAKHGINKLVFKKTNGFIDALRSLVKEPMIILLLVASCIYFISGSIGDGLFMGAAIIMVAFISLYQDSRSRNALEKLKEFAQPNAKVIRNGIIIKIKSEDNGTS